MISFKEFRKEFIFRNTKICTYWEQSTQCHLLACPFYSHNITPEKRLSLNKRVKDTVTFKASDFDKQRNSVQALIDESKTEGISSIDRFKDSPKSSVLTKDEVRGRLLENFDKFDTDGSGSLSKDELPQPKNRA